MAPYTSFSGNITVPTISGGIHSVEATAFEVFGTAGVFDANGSVPAQRVTSGLFTWTTNTANDFLFINGIDASINPAATAAGWTRINTAAGATGTQNVFCQLVNSAGSQSFAMDSGSNVDEGVTADAITPGAGAPPAVSRLVGLLGD
jgi:hypothetical protein